MATSVLLFVVVFYSLVKIHQIDQEIFDEIAVLVRQNFTTFHSEILTVFRNHGVTES